ncbi:15719_t:CDS:2 [Acaulospora colombiana]|uniref:15719_t:CDS:1 n=1 Tax=Acaulospora colombiana TaxID=27376 RepID=A0ACA9NBI1_9GLOM|nr:15719_t:CDS:2 [Acaulospora colombiana]
MSVIMYMSAYGLRVMEVESGGISPPAPDPRYMQYYAKTPYVFMPFNAGPRSCLGQQLAIAEVGVWLVRLVQRLQESKAMQDVASPFYTGEKADKKVGGMGWDAMVQLDEDAIPLNARVPPSWKEEGKAWQSSSSSSDSWNTDLEGGQAYEKSSSPIDNEERQPLLSPSNGESGGKAEDAWLPSETPTGVSPRRAIEKVWPKSHLTMFIEGGLWMRLAL